MKLMDYRDLPEELPIFPLTGVLLLPGGRLPLNIFEPRYLAMFDDALSSNRLIGMIQPRVFNGQELYSIGCAGRVVEFVETPDGRYEVVLSGLSRFSIGDEITSTKGYRRVRPQWSDFESDITYANSCLGLERPKLKALLQSYFSQQEMSCDWDAFDEATDGKLMTCLSMTCPFEPAEKQALLEEKCCKARAKMFMTLLEMEVRKVAL